MISAVNRISFGDLKADSIQALGYKVEKLNAALKTQDANETQKSVQQEKLIGLTQKSLEVQMKILNSLENKSSSTRY